MGLFHAFNRLVTSRIAVGLVLFAVLALLIWYGGPNLAIDGAEPLASQGNRLLAVAGLAALFLVLEVFRRWRLNRLNRRILSSLGSVDGAPELDDRIGRVREGYTMLCEALRTHGGARLRNRRHLHEQSWYLLLGETGAGRSSALANSGLEFVLDIGHFTPATGRAPERAGECGWWVTEDAVFVVAPGDFVTELDPAQAAEWDDLLDCLKSGRRRHPLTGIIVTIPATSLLYEPTALEIAGQMRRRLQEAMTRFGMALPVYLLITKCDRIAGFTQFFSNLHPEERAQPFGVTLPPVKLRPLFSRARARHRFVPGAMPGAAALAEFAERYREFIVSLAAWAPSRLAAERDADHRRRMFGFPQQMQALGEPLEAVVRRMFGSSRFRRDALFRGVFFASARQRGPVTDIVMQIHRQAWDLAVPEPATHNPERTASFFLKGLFQDLILPERGLTGRDPAIRRRTLLASVATFALTGTAAFALGACLWLGSIDTERQARAMSHALDVHEISHVAVPENDFAQAALAVAPMRSEPPPPDAAASGDPADAAAWGTALWRRAQRLGTFAGRTMLRTSTGLSERLNDAYTAAAHHLVRPAVVRELGNEVALLAGAGDRSIEKLRALLAIYLGLTDTARFDPDALRAWAGRHVRGRYPLSPDAQAQVVAVVGDAFDGLDTPHAIDRAIVAAARERLRLPPGEEIHARMLEDNSKSSPAVSIDSALHERVAWVFASTATGTPALSVPGYFSEPGLHERFLPHAPRAIQDYRRNDWLAGEEAAAISDEAVFAELGAAYARDYVAAWSEFLDGLALQEAVTAAQALQMMETLLSSDSPIDGLVRMVSEHTVLPVVRDSEGDGAGRPANGDGAGGGVLGAVADKAQHAVGQQYAMWPGDAVRQAFAPYHALRDDRTGDLPGIAAIRARLGDLHAAMATVDGEPDPAQAAFGQVRAWIDDPRESEVNALRRVAMIQPKPLRRMLIALSDQSTAILMKSARMHLARRWRDTVFEECRRAIAGRYPIDREAESAIAPDDFESFFAADGTIDRFFREHVEPFVDTIGGGWQERTLLGHRVGLRDRALETFRNAGTIRDAFGLDAAALGAAGFTIEPSNLDSNALWVTVETSFATFRYRHEPPRRFRMKLAEEAVSIGISDRTGAVHVHRLNVPWAWFRMFDRFRIEPAEVPDQHDFTVELGELEAGFRISADSIVNPLAPRILTRFRCEERLL